VHSWIEIIGFAGSFLTVVTYLMRSMVRLRIIAIASSLCFAFYGSMIGSPPLVLMEAVLLPLNAYRLYQIGKEQA
jgi:hypothetical protein